MSPDTAVRDRATMLCDLLANRAWQDTPAVEWIPRAQQALVDGAATAEQISRAVRMLTPMRRRRYEPIPDGRYMVAERRFRCTTPTEGRWAGFTTVNEISKGGGESLLRGDARREALSLIGGVSHQLAAVRYGKLTGRCGYCHLQLTDQRSLDAGAGRDCAKKHGIPW